MRYGSLEHLCRGNIQYLKSVFQLFRHLRFERWPESESRKGRSVLRSEMNYLPDYKIIPRNGFSAYFFRDAIQGGKEERKGAPIALQSSDRHRWELKERRKISNIYFPSKEMLY